MSQVQFRWTAALPLLPDTEEELADPDTAALLTAKIAAARTRLRSVRSTAVAFALVAAAAVVAAAVGSAVGYGAGGAELSTAIVIPSTIVAMLGSLWVMSKLGIPSLAHICTALVPFTVAAMVFAIYLPVRVSMDTELAARPFPCSSADPAAPALLSHTWFDASARPAIALSDYAVSQSSVKDGKSTIDFFLAPIVCLDDGGGAGSSSSEPREIVAFAAWCKEHAGSGCLAFLPVMDGGINEAHLRHSPITALLRLRSGTQQFRSKIRASLAKLADDANATVSLAYPPDSVPIYASVGLPAVRRHLNLVVMLAPACLFALSAVILRLFN